ncbi:MAG: serine/threonine-protein kinase [Kofleriaceae bacterium]
MPAEARDRVGSVIGGRYCLDRLIGRGAMAEVYRARALPDEQPVAVKILHRNVASDASTLHRFAREAHVLSMLQHRNVASLLAFGATPEQEPYLVMELLRGRSLRGVVKDGAVPPRRAGSYIWQALQGLAAVHAVGVLHRDLKPANVMVEPASSGGGERIALIDFGFASLDGGARLTEEGTLVGSLTYIAPERLRGEAPDERSDLYALGIMLFELLTGAPPFAADDALALMNLHLHAPPPTPAAAAPFAEVIRTALEKEPGRRYASALEMAAALAAAAPSLPV